MLINNKRKLEAYVYRQFDEAVGQLPHLTEETLRDSIHLFKSVLSAQKCTKELTRTGIRKALLSKQGIWGPDEVALIDLCFPAQLGPLGRQSLSSLCDSFEKVTKQDLLDMPQAAKAAEKNERTNEALDYLLNGKIRVAPNGTGNTMNSIKDSMPLVGIAEPPDTELKLYVKLVFATKGFKAVLNELMAKKESGWLNTALIAWINAWVDVDSPDWPNILGPITFKPHHRIPDGLIPESMKFKQDSNMKYELVPPNCLTFDFALRGSDKPTDCSPSILLKALKERAPLSDSNFTFLVEPIDESTETGKKCQPTRPKGSEISKLERFVKCLEFFASKNEPTKHSFQTLMTPGKTFLLNLLQLFQNLRNDKYDFRKVIVITSDQPVQDVISLIGGVMEYYNVTSLYHRPILPLEFDENLTKCLIQRAHQVN